jgi:hypothetical protein
MHGALANSSECMQECERQAACMVRTGKLVVMLGAREVRRHGGPRGGVEDTGGAQVGREDDDGVLEGDHAAVAVRAPPIIQDLQQHVEHVVVRLLDLIKQHHAVRLAPHGLRELTTCTAAQPRSLLVMAHPPRAHLMHISTG